MKLKILFILLLLGYLKATHAYTTNWSDTIHIKEQLSLAIKLQRTKQDSSLHLAQSAYKSSLALNYQKGIASALIRIGSIYYTNGKYDTAQILIEKALAIRKSLSDFKGASGACILLSYIHQSKGKQDSAYSLLYQSLHYNELIGDSINMVQTYIVLGNLSVSYNDPVVAIKSYQQAENISIQLNYNEGKLLADDGLGNYYLKIKDFEKALTYFQKIDTLSNLSMDIISNAQNSLNIGICYENLNKIELAKQYYNYAIAVLFSHSLRDELAKAYFRIGNLFNKLHSPDSAIYYLNKALPIAEEIGILDLRAECYQKLSEAHASKGDYFKAYNYHIQFASLSDSILNKEKIKQIAEMQTKYETEKKEVQIVLLNEQNKSKLIERNFFIAGTVLFLLLASAILIGLIKTRKEKKIADSLLLNILPYEVANELKRTGSSEAKLYNHVTVLFTDFVNFTGISEQMSPTELVKEINKNFTAFDSIIEKHGLEKIKTIGDAYLAVSGLPFETPDHAERVVKAAIDLQSYMLQKNGKFELRIGIHSGPVVAGIVGVKKFAYDIWGDTVNTASRMEGKSEAGKINISDATYELIKNQFACTYRGKIEAKHKGMIDMYFVDYIL